MPTQDRRCRTCAHYGLPPDVRPHKNKVWACRWVMPESYVFPDSMTRGHQNRYEAIQIEVKGYMSPNDGQTCPTWELRRPTANV